MSGAQTYAVVQYRGHDFAGWQLQPSLRTGQGEFEAVLRRLIGHRVVTRAAGRTDAGVHALAQVVGFSVPERWRPDELQRALRALLPHDIWVVKVRRAPHGFDARRDATARRYRYVIGCDDAAASPFRRPFEWALCRPLDGRLLNGVCALVTGEHDFRGFCAVGQDKPHYRCKITTAEWYERANGEGFIFEIEADRFLHHMVRFLVGTMVDVARGRRPEQDVSRLLTDKNNKNASPPAPPEGLYFLGARYPQMNEVINQ
jgi:tRNA pseudouridine38-40 synthase